MKAWRIGFVILGVACGVVLACSGLAPATPVAPAITEEPPPQGWMIRSVPWRDAPVFSPAARPTPPARSILEIEEPALPVVAPLPRSGFERWRRLQPYSLYQDPVTTYLLQDE